MVEGLDGPEEKQAELEGERRRKFGKKTNTELAGRFRTRTFCCFFRMRLRDGLWTAREKSTDRSRGSKGIQGRRWYEGPKKLGQQKCH